jgi:peptide/nickel transport system permease protein
MLRFIATRLALAVPTLLAISFLVFFASYLAPGDPVDTLVGQRATPEIKARVRHDLGLDRPPLVRYGEYVWNIVSRGDFGVSYQNREPIKTKIARSFPNTALLATSALLLSLLAGIPLGIISAVHANRLFDRLAMGTALVGVAVPSFVLGPVLVILLALRAKALPVTAFSLGEHPVWQYLFGQVNGRPGWHFLVLPTIVLAARSTALIARLTRSAMLDVLQQDYIRTARAKGLSGGAVLLKHALKNAFPPILTVAGTTFGYLLSGSFVVERLFKIPGLGDQSITSILQRDYPVVQAMALLLAATFVIVNLVVDLLYGVFDPRARVGGGGRLGGALLQRAGGTQR